MIRGKMMANDLFTAKQKAFYRDSLTLGRMWNIQTGAVSSGKTYLDFFRIPRRLVNTKGLGLIVFMGNTQATLERNIFEPMRNIWGDELVGTVKSNNKIDMFGYECYAIGADNKRQVNRIRGATIEYCYGDEVATWAEEVFQMLKSRLRTDNSVFDGTTNPEHGEHWLKKFLDSDQDILQQSYVIDDNTFLSKKYIKELKRSYVGTVYYDRYILGRWVAASGLIYPQFANREKEMTYSTAPWVGRIQTDVRYYVSIDYGTYNPFVALLWRIDKNIAYCEGELYYDGRKEQYQKTDEEYVNDLLEWLAPYNVVGVIIDPSASSFIVALDRRNKYKIMGAVNDVINGIRVSSSLLGSGRIKVHTGCENLIRELKSYLWDEDKSEKGKDRPLEQNDHAPDAMRYFCSTILSRLLKWIDWDTRKA